MISRARACRLVVLQLRLSVLSVAELFGRLVAFLFLWGRGGVGRYGLLPMYLNMVNFYKTPVNVLINVNTIATLISAVWYVRFVRKSASLGACVL